MAKEDAVPTPTSEDNRSINEWMQELAGVSSLQVKVKRIYPRVWKGRQVGGILDTLDTMVDESELKERYGGGKLEIRVFTPGPKGNLVFNRQRTLEIAGDPKIDGTMFAEPAHDSGSNGDSVDTSLQRHALGLAERMALEDRKRSERLEGELRDNMRSSGPDPQLLQAILSPLQSQVQTLTQQLDGRNREVMDLLSKRGEPTTADRLLETTLREEQTRLASVRTAHDAEMRTLRESFMQDLKRAEDRADRLIEQNERAHTREVESLKRAYEGQIDNLKVSFESRIDGLKTDSARYAEELRASKSELEKLRDKKEQPIEEQLAKLLQLKELFAEAMGGDEQPESIIERLIDKAAPVIEGVGARIAGTQPEVQALPQAQTQVTGKTKRVVLPSGTPIPLNPTDVKTALGLIESAINNGTTPEAFASTIRHMVPTSVLDALTQPGIDAFIETVAKQNPQSPIATQAGVNFLRKVAKILVPGT